MTSFVELSICYIVYDTYEYELVSGLQKCV